MNTLTDEDFNSAARMLNCDVEAIKAVAKVESGGRSGSLADGLPMILFEAHKFSKHTDGDFDTTHPNISSPVWNKALYKGGAAEYARLAEAMRLAPIEAMMSASWGMFQILGENYVMVGHPTVAHFVASQDSAKEQLLAFVTFVKSAKLDDELRAHNWAGFARGYNGTGYRLNKYDEKIAAEYERLTEGQGQASNGTLRSGSTGANVKSLQQYLNRHDFNLVVDGDFGRATRIAVERFQAAHGLEDDGVVGAKTWEVLIHGRDT